MKNKNRLEAFSDGVLAIIVTIMVLELKVPETMGWQGIANNWFSYSSYALSFFAVGLYWKAHSYLFEFVESINDNSFLLGLVSLFFVSFLPYATKMVNEHNMAKTSVAFYAGILVLNNITYFLMVRQLRKIHDEDSQYLKTFASDYRSIFTLFANLLCGLIALMGFPKIGFFSIFVIYLFWIIPHHQFEKFFYKK